MAITELSRHHLFQRLETVLGPEEATTLMDHLPPVGWADVATRGDLDHLQSALEHQLHAEIGTVRVDMATLEQQLHAEIGTVRVDMATMETSLRLSIASLETSLTGKIEKLETSLTGKIEGVRVDMAKLETSLTGQVDKFEAKLVGSFGDFRDQLSRDQRTASRQIMAALVVAIISLLLTSAHLH